MRINEAFIKLGFWIDENDAELQNLMAGAVFENPWFTEKQVRQAIASIRSEFLEESKLNIWLEKYKSSPRDRVFRVALVLAGNIPLVGFHDLMCTLCSHHIALVKLSERDRILIPGLINKMLTWSPDLSDKVIFTDRLADFDAVIATGSNQSARYFEKYFGRHPHIIRKNRNAVAVLTGKERDDELRLLGNDIFSYFGLGCRNVTKIYVPGNYDFAKLLTLLNDFREVADHHKYQNNYDYHLATALINREAYMSNDCLLLLQNASIASRVAVLHYEFYEDREDLNAELIKHQDEIQCVVGNLPFDGFQVVPFGSAQYPQLDDYADGLDTMSFLGGLSNKTE
ncbi:MAG: acyl-CoA reductase [Saprospiraceae bacterium]|nr:acyl-CoA reductase [Saprospiraceae bacterium]